MSVDDVLTNNDSNFKFNEADILNGSDDDKRQYIDDFKHFTDEIINICLK